MRRAKCTQVIITNDRCFVCRREGELTDCAGGPTARSKVVYLHPALLSLRVYIFPMSPIPMMPIVKFSMEEAMLAILRALSRLFVLSCRVQELMIVRDQPVECDARDGD